MTVDTAVCAYIGGYLPWGGINGVGWRRPETRYYLDLSHPRFPSDVRRRRDNRGLEFTLNHRFEDVLQHSAEVSRSNDDRWITPSIIDLYLDMNRAGLTFSSEVWHGAELVAGEFGILLGGTYYCESKFHYRAGAGSVSTGVAVMMLAKMGVGVYDCQYGPAYMARFSTLGMQSVPRREFPLLTASAATRCFPRRLHSSGSPYGSRQRLSALSGLE